MFGAYVSLHYHFVFSTKSQEPVIAAFSVSATSRDAVKEYIAQ